jgi:hypothetical protein
MRVSHKDLHLNIRFQDTAKASKVDFNSHSVISGVGSTIAAWSLLLAILSFPLCSAASVKVEVPSKSSSNVRLTVLLNGKPQKGATIKIYRYELGPGEEAKPRFSLISDKEGMAFQPKLALGHYHVVASTAKNLRADLFLDVSEHDNEKASEFPMLLEAGDITHEQLFAKAEQMPIKERVKVFNGMVRDPAGALYGEKGDITSSSRNNSCAS